MNDSPELTDHHLGDNATVTLPLRIALDLWMISDGDLRELQEEFLDYMDPASRAAGFDGIVDAYHRCGPGVLTSDDLRISQRVGSSVHALQLARVAGQIGDKPS